MIEIKNLSKSFNGAPVLQNFSLSIKQGEIAVLLGSSGSGKSTILRLVVGLERPDSGQIERGCATTFVSQSYGLFSHLSALENITIVLREVAGLDSAAAAYEGASLLEEFDLMDQANFRISQLSGGQKQRLAIARAIASGAKILCLDEPSSALDPERTQDLRDIVVNLAHSGYAMLIATHDISFAMMLPCTLHLLQDGRLTERASIKDFLKRPKAFPRLKMFVGGAS